VINKEQLMKENLDKVKLLASNLRQRRRHIGLRKQDTRHSRQTGVRH